MQAPTSFDMTIIPGRGWRAGADGPRGFVLYGHDPAKLAKEAAACLEHELERDRAASEQPPHPKS